MNQASKKSINLLFTSAGRRVELLRAFRKALSELGIAGRLVTVDIDPLAPSFQFADQTYIVPAFGSESHVEALLAICRKEWIDLVFPLIDPDIPVLAKHRALFEAIGARVAVPSHEATLIAADKWRTTDFFHQLGLPVPRTWLPTELRTVEATFPLFIKPRQGSAAKYTFKINDARALDFFSTYVPDPVLQEYLPGPEITSDVVCDMTGRILTVVCRQRIEVRAGEVSKGVTVRNNSIIESCVKIAHAMKAVGPITVQALMKNGVPHFTEVNARAGGGAPLGIAAGANWPLWLLAREAGIPLDVPALGSYQTGFYFTRFDESLYLNEPDYAKLASRRI